MIGIYKITSPERKIYIGQSNNIEKRFEQYKKLNCEGQIKLYDSFLKYGFESHIFEVIEECDIKLLNDLERYYQDLYSVISDNGLNCSLTKSTDKSGLLCPETFLKMRGRKDTANHLKKIILNTQTGIFYFGVKEAALSHGLNTGTLTSRLSGIMENNTNFIYI